MKKPAIIISILLILFGTASSAQENNEVPVKKPKRFSMGVQAMMIHTSGKDLNIADLGIGFTMRYFMTERLAVSAQLNSTRSLKYYTPGATLNRNGFEVPVQLEYHLLPGSKVRPFFAAGAGLSSQHTAMKYNDGRPTSYTYNQSAFLQLGYGVSFNVGKKMLLSTLLSYRYNVSTHQHGMALSLGFGWRHYKK